MRGRYYVVTDEVSGVTFYFAFDRIERDRLHITHSHGTTPEQAIRIFVDPYASTIYLASRRRWERHVGTGLVAWIWLDEPMRRSALILTCMEQEVSE